MSQALPMTSERRLDIYRASRRTPRQLYRFARMTNRESLRAQGVLTHGATGERIRRPLEFVSKPPERGSIRTHIAGYCGPCDRHARPRLHRFPKTSAPAQLPSAPAAESPTSRSSR
jgi:hypothetical protein